jgi:hypothetical protein
VFVTWLKPEGPNPLSILAHQLRRRFRSNNSLLRGARLAYRTATRRIAFLSACPACQEPKSPVKTIRLSAALLGPIPLASRFALDPERP